MDMLQSHLKVAKDDNSTASISHVAGTCFAVYSNITHNESWIIDSGASSHICHQRSLLVSHISVILPTSSQITVDYIGNIRLSYDFSSRCPLYPQFTYNLLSVSVILQHGCFFIEFSGASCIIQDKSLCKMIGGADCIHGLYRLSLPLHTNLGNKDVPALTFQL